MVKGDGRAVGQMATTRARPLAYEKIKRAIITGELTPGQVLVETTLAQWCGVSRTPVREALRSLEQDGLVHRRDGGLVVRERTPAEILDIYEARIVLEATVGRVAAERRTEHDVRMLRVVLGRGAALPAADIAAVVEANQQFHRLVWRASHNESLIDLLERLSLHLARYPETTLGYPGRWETACGEHAQLVDAIEARKGNDAYDVARRHYTAARDIRLLLFAEESAGI